MSLILSDSTPKDLTIKTCGLRILVGCRENEHLEQIVMLGDCEIPMSYFCAAVEYVLSNTDLDKNDPRIGLVDRIKNAYHIVPGHNAVAGIDPNSTMYDFQYEDCPYCVGRTGMVSATCENCLGTGKVHVLPTREGSV